MKTVHYQMVRLGEIAHVTTGKSNVEDATETGIYPFYDRSQVIKRSNRFLFDVPSAIIVPGEGTQFIPRIAHGKFDLHQRAYAVILREDVSAEYIYYAILNAHEYFATVATGSTVSSLRLGMFLHMPIHLPDLPTQLRIAGVLGSIDEKIELNRRKIAELEALAKTIYDYWFVQFDFPDATGRPYKSSGGKMVWNGQLKREVPEGWEVVLLSNLCSISTKQCVPSKMDCNLLEHYSIPAFDEGVYPSFDPPAAILSNKFVVPQGGILYSKLNAQFKRIWDPLHLTALPIASSEFVIYVPHDLQLRGFIYATLNAERVYKFANSISSCSTGSRKRFTPETTYRFPVAIPNDNEIVERFSKLFSDILGSIKKCRVEGVMLRDTRDTLLPLLMNGQVVVG